MIEICKPGFRCESCPMNDLPPDEQFTPEFNPSTNDVTVRLTGEDAGATFNVFKRFDQKTLVGTEVQFTVQSDLCEYAREAGAVEDEVVASLIDNGIERAENLVSSGARPVSGVKDLLMLELEVIGVFGDIERKALASVIMRLAEV